MNPVITFIVPTYKRPETLLRCLTSIKTFIYVDIEIIVIDDSMDGEGSAAAVSVGAKYIRKSKADRRGPGASRNMGLSLAKGDFVVFIDDDDFLLGDDLQKMVAGADGNDLLFANYFIYANDGLSPRTVAGVGVDDLLVLNRLPMGSFAVRRSAITYGFDEDMRSHEDWDFLLRNIYHWKLKHFDCSPIAIDKSLNDTSSISARSRQFFWIDFLSIYSRFPCPRLAEKRCQTMRSMGLNLAPEQLAFDPSVGQRVF